MTTPSDIAGLLEQYDCPHGAAVVRMRFWGAINSPVANIAPLKEIDHLWHGERRPFASEDEARAFYDAMINFWNSLAGNRASGKPIAFTTRTGLDTIDGLKTAIASRYAELEDGFFTGFVGNLRPRDPVDGRIDRNIHKLSQLMKEMDELLHQPIGSGNVNKVRSRFVALDKRAQKVINQLVMQTLLLARGS